MLNFHKGERLNGNRIAIAQRRSPGVVLAIAALALASESAIADETGVSFWLPGQHGSLAALPSQPGWSVATIYFHTSVDAGADAPFLRGGQIQTGLDADADIGMLNIAYVFANPVLGGQAAVNVTGTYGQMKAAIDATLTGRRGNTISGFRSDTLTGFGDLYPTVSIKWNQGVHNFMTYLAGDIPVGAYNPRRLANLGIGHGAVDGGVGYTYLNTTTGREFSAVTDVTYNFENSDTDYQNGIDWHLDWGLSQFLSEHIHIGAVGYFYQQITGDSGSGASLGDFKSSVIGVGPQVGFVFPVGSAQGYLNFKGYKEFEGENRPTGWNAWMVFQISAAAPTPAKPAAAAPAAVATMPKDYTIYFELDKANITDAAGAVLDEIKTNTTPAQSVSVVGHTDTSGSAAHNQRLSDLRANNTATGLTARKVTVSSVGGVGEGDPAVPTPDGVNEPLNRRSVIEIQGTAASQ